MFLTILAILLLIFSAVLIGWLESGSEPVPTVKNQTSTLPASSSTAGARALEQSPAQINSPVNSPARSKRSSNASLKSLPKSSRRARRRQGTPSRSVARLNQRISARDRFESNPRADRSSGTGIPRALREANRNGSEAQADRVAQPLSPRGEMVATGSQKSETAVLKETQPTSRTAARQTARRDVSNERSSKLTAFLKTTWKVLKKPFDF